MRVRSLPRWIMTRHAPLSVALAIMVLKLVRVGDGVAVDGRDAVAQFERPRVFSGRWEISTPGPGSSGL